MMVELSAKAKMNLMNVGTRTNGDARHARPESFSEFVEMLRNTPREQYVGPVFDAMHEAMLNEADVDPDYSPEHNAERDAMGSGGEEFIN